MQARQPEDVDKFFSTITDKLRGKRVFMIGAYNLMYDVAKAGLERGIKNVFAKDSAILTGGGIKGFVLPDNYMDVIRSSSASTASRRVTACPRTAHSTGPAARGAITCSRG